MKIKHIIVAAGIGCAALVLSSSSRADMVTDWNETAEIVIRASTPSPPIQTRALAIVNAAIYDAVNGIAGTYQPYFVTDPAPPGARKEAAAAQAAFTALLGLFPGQAGLLEEKLAESSRAFQATGAGANLSRADKLGASMSLKPCWPGAQRMACQQSCRLTSVALLPVSGVRFPMARSRARCHSMRCSCLSR
jgi:hypothetical protein